NAKDLIRFTVYDELTLQDDAQDQGLHRDPNVYKHITLRRYLGSLSIPVNTIYWAQCLQGAFHLRGPGEGGGAGAPVNLGFRQLHCTEPRLLNLYITLTPELAHPEPVLDDWQCGEEGEIARLVIQWEKSLFANPICKGRVIKAMATDPEGTAVFLPRYICPMAPPDCLLQHASASHATGGSDSLDPKASTADDPLMRRMLRFVSMIPFAPDLRTIRRHTDVWMTCRDFFDLCAGDNEEHAITLCNYLLYINQQAFVALGTGIQDGEAAYVITLGALSGEGDEVISWRRGRAMVWDPSNGHVCAVGDHTCGLRQVGVLFNDRNIWANIQARGEPWEISFDLSDQRCWKPFFQDKGSRRPELGTVQVPMKYTSIPSEFFRELELFLERHIMDVISGARRLTYTRFNRRCTRVLKQLLKDLELQQQALPLPTTSEDESPLFRMDRNRILFGNAIGSFLSEDLVSSNVEDSHYSALAPFMKTHDVMGFPLNMPLTDPESITKAVLSTEIHQNYSKNVEFAVATYVYSYGVSFVCSLWIYVATLQKKV
ncbi:hypothetical protein CBR_g34323, partial [Chara braunii]